MRLKHFLLVILTMLLLSCNNNVSVVVIHDLSGDVWRSDSPIELRFTQEDSLSDNTLNLLVRHTPDFGYDRLLLEVRTEDPNRKYWCDTIAIQLARSDKWLGHNMTTHVDHSVPYRYGVRFMGKGDYTMRLKYVYPNDSLRGVKALGLIIEKNGKE